MRIWLVQRAESTPHDDKGNRRLMRIGILANILSSNGHEVIWWTSAFDHVSKKKRYPKSTKVMVNKNYYIHYLKCFGYKKNISFSRYLDNIVVSNQFKKDANLEKVQPDIILTSIPSIELSKMVIDYANKKNIPVVIDIRDLWPDVFSELLPNALEGLIKIFTKSMRKKLIYVCSKANIISGITDNFVEWGIKHSGRERSSKDRSFPMAYIKNEIDKEKKLNAYLFWENLGLLSDDGILNVLFLGTFTKSFEFETVFSAAKILQDRTAPVRFIFCGNGSKEFEIKKSCEELPNCVFGGWVNAAQIKTVLELSDVGLAPYIHAKNFIENFPNKPAEYLSHNLSIATSLRHGKLFDFINSHECGLSYGSDSLKLSQFLEELALNDKKLNRMSKNAEKAFKNELDGQKVYHSLMNFLEKNSKRS